MLSRPRHAPLPRVPSVHQHSLAQVQARLASSEVRVVQRVLRGFPDGLLELLEPHALLVPYDRQRPHFLGDVVGLDASGLFNRRRKMMRRK